MSRRRAFALVTALLFAGCRAAPATSAPTVTPVPTTTSASTLLPGGVAAPELKVTVSDARYGALTATTAAGASCSALLGVRAGHFGEQPPAALPTTIANTAGVARWTYTTPRVPQGAGTYSVTCTNATATGTATGSFDIAAPPVLKATGFAVHLSVSAPPGATYNPDPSLVPLRDAAVAKMRATLTAEWKSATRGLGGLTVTDDPADITMYVVAARGTSVHRGSDDGSQDIVVYVSDTFGPETVENVIATALHELGHIWCCYGDGTSEGHWLTKERDPGLYGVDKYGLMTDPVTCLVFGSIVSCPNRFSDREMAALGFASFPPPTMDPCVQQALSLTSSVSSLNAQLDRLSIQINSLETQLTSIKQQLQTIEAKYPNGMPPLVVTQYNALVDQYNGLAAQDRATVSTYNATLAQAKTQAAQLSGLPCDAS